MTRRGSGLWALLCVGLAGGCEAADDRRVDPGDAEVVDAPDSGHAADAGPTHAGGDCQLLEQDCPSAGDKCTLVESGGPRAAACVALRGQAAENEPCERGPEGFGNDDCAPGLFCSYIGELGPAQGGVRRCHPLCESDAQCPSGQRCGVLTDAPRPGGFCGPSCAPFSDCGAGLTCGDLYSGEGGSSDLWLACRPIGAQRSGDPCETAYECPAEHVCGDNGTCAALCDAEHPCAAGSCQLVGAAGLCV